MIKPDPLCPCGSPRLLGHAGCPRCEDVRRTLYVQHAPGPLALPAVEPPDRPMGRAQARMVGVRR